LEIDDTKRIQTPHKVLQAFYNGIKIRYDPDTNKFIAFTVDGIKITQLWIGDIENANIAAQNVPHSERYGAFLIDRENHESFGLMG